MPRLKRLLAAAAAAAVVTTALVAPSPAFAAGPNLAAGKTFSASSYTDVYPAGNAGDGNANTYWESNNNAFPQWVQVDLGTATQVNQVVLKLPPASAWATRTQTLSLQGSTDGGSFSTLKASAGYVVISATGNTNVNTISKVPRHTPRSTSIGQRPTSNSDPNRYERLSTFTTQNAALTTRIQIE